MACVVVGEYNRSLHKNMDHIQTSVQEIFEKRSKTQPKCTPSIQRNVCLKPNRKYE